MDSQMLYSHVLYPLLWLVAGNALLFLLSKLNKKFCLAALLVFNSVFLSLFVLEVGMQLFYCQSDGYDITMSSKKWFARYWHPINELGYRDDSHAAPPPGVKTVFVLGDSFAAGHGIENYKDRFANLLGAKLGPGYKVMDVAQNGWDTPEEFEALRSHPLKPDIVIWSYFVNDILKAALKSGFAMPFEVKFPSGKWKEYLVDNYSLANFLYWRLLRFGNFDKATESFWDRLRAAYSDEKSWELHTREMQAIIDYCRDNGIKLYSIVFPHFLDVKGSEEITRKVAEFLRSQGVSTLEFAPKLAGRDPLSTVVNSSDAHPSREMQNVIAGSLFECLQNGGCAQ